MAEDAHALDASTHEQYLDQIQHTLREILREIRGLRGGVRQLTQEIAGELPEESKLSA
jgi:cell division septum initiation protein DivIVA